MAKFSLEQVNDMYYDVLKELGNIGAGNATTAISNMLNLKVDMKVPKVQFWISRSCQAQFLLRRIRSRGFTWKWKLILEGA